MSDFKAKLPDFKEITSIASKLFKDVKNSVCEIIDDFKKKRKETGSASAQDKSATAKTKKEEPKTEKKQTKPPESKK